MSHLLISPHCATDINTRLREDNFLVANLKTINFDEVSQNQLWGWTGSARRSGPLRDVDGKPQPLNWSITSDCRFLEDKTN